MMEGGSRKGGRACGGAGSRPAEGGAHPFPGMGGMEKKRRLCAGGLPGRTLREFPAASISFNIINGFLINDNERQ